MGTELKQGDTYIGSHEKADNNYGQNGFLGSPRTNPGESVSSNFLPELRGKTPINSQTRTVDASPIAPAHNMRNRNTESKNTIPPNGRPVKR
jgi:hypothetical protein